MAACGAAANTTPTLVAPNAAMVTIASRKAKSVRPFRDAREVVRTGGATVCDVKARGRELRVMSAGLGAVSVRPLELCLWGACRGVAGCDAGRGAGYAGRPVRGSWTPGPPTPRGAPSAYHVGAAEAGRRHGLLRPIASVVPRPPSGVGTVQHPADAPDGCQGEIGPAVSSISGTCTTTRRGGTVSDM